MLSQSWVPSNRTSAPHNTGFTCEHPVGYSRSNLNLQSSFSHALQPMSSRAADMTPEHPVGRSRSNLNLQTSMDSLQSTQWGAHAAISTSNVYYFNLLFQSSVLPQHHYEINPRLIGMSHEPGHLSNGGPGVVSRAASRGPLRCLRGWVASPEWSHFGGALAATTT